MPLLERARVEVYVPDLPAPHYRNLLLSFEEEFTYAFGGCTIVRALDKVREYRDKEYETLRARHPTRRSSARVV